MTGPPDVATKLAILPLRVEALCFGADGTPLLENVSFVLEGGRRTVVLGANGAGKSLLLRLCHGLLQPTAGRILWDGPDASPGKSVRPPARAHVMVFQRPVMLRRTVAANIDYAAGLERLAKTSRAQRVAEALRLGGLEALAERPARVLSGGEQQRLAIVRAWVCRPAVLFLDEPTANLDPSATGAVERLIQAIHDGGTKIIMTTHDLGQARRLADEVLFLHRGHLLEHNSASAFFAAPATPEARAFVAGELLW